MKNSVENQNVVITGLGVITSNGKDIEQFYANSMEGIRGIDDASSFFDVSSFRTKYWGVIPTNVLESFHTEWKDSLLFKEKQMAAYAVDQALETAGLTSEELLKAGSRTALFVGSLSLDDAQFLGHDASALEAEAQEERADKLLAQKEFASFLREYTGVQGPYYEISSACSSGSAILGLGYDLIASGDYDYVVVCGIDSLSWVNAYGFNALKALSTGKCHPLDSERDGINIGEGCGVIILESQKNALKRQADIYSILCGYSIGNEAFHITSPDTSGEGFYQSMKTALENAKVPASKIDYINLHGTGTPVNDITELLAVNKLFGETEKPYISSLKTLIGHCMGAAGTLEAAMTVMNLKRGEVLPVSHIQNIMPEAKDYLQKPEEAPKFAISNSFAFAGNTASVVLAAPDAYDFEDAGEAEKLEDAKTADSPEDLKVLGKLCDNRHQEDSLKEIWIQDFVCNYPENLGTGESLDDDIQEISPRALRGVSHLSLLALQGGMKVCREAWGDDFSNKPEAHRVGTIFSSRYGALNGRFQLAKQPLKFFNPNQFAQVSPNAPVGTVSMHIQAKGCSTSLRGSFPLPLAGMFIANGMCDQVICQSGEEFYEALSESMKIKEKHSYDENMVTFLLSNKKTENSCCRVNKIWSCSTENAKELVGEVIQKKILQNDYMEPTFLLENENLDFCKEEKSLIQELLPNPRFISPDKDYSMLLNNTLAAHITLGAAGIKNNQYNKIFVTGHDSQGTYYIVELGKE